MPRYLIKLEKDNQSWYMEWSTIVDAPTTYGMNLEEFKEFYKNTYPNEINFSERMVRVEAKGTSSMLYSSVNELISYNRAGENETCLTKDELIEKYCKVNK